MKVFVAAGSGARAVQASRPAAVVHQLTALPKEGVRRSSDIVAEYTGSAAPHSVPAWRPPYPHMRDGLSGMLHGAA